jgi:hypothetical protein
MVAMRAYRDPVTGAFTDPPAASAGSTAALHAAPSGAAAPLPELPSPGGGTYIDMRGEPMVLVKTPPSKDGGASPARTVDHPAVP